MRLPIDTSWLKLLVVAPAEPLRQLRRASPGRRGRPGRTSTYPAVVIELRDGLRERAQRARSAGRDLHRRYSDGQIQRAVELIAQGKTVKEVAYAVGAPPDRVRRWLKRAGQSRLAGRRYYTAGEVNRALSLLNQGASLRQAAAAVGATSATVVRWRRLAAA